MDTADQHDELFPDLGQDQDQEELFEHHRIVVDRFQSLLRIDKFLMNRLQNVSRNRIQGAADAGTILVNGKNIKSSYKVKPGDVITIVLAHPPREIELYPDDIPLDIRYEDDQLFVINKQAGLVVHPAYGHYRGTLVNGIVHLMHPKLNGAPLTSESVRPGLVHRIDKDTTGLIVIAKNEQALSHLAKQFYDRTIDRHYLALVWGDFTEDAGTVSVHIGRSNSDRKVMDAFPDASQGKHAVTHWEVLERFGYVTLIRCKLETGRTHQIRIHMKYIGHPLFGDKTYGGDRIVKGTVFSKYRQFIDNCFEILPRQALHARSIGFRHPSDGRMVYLEAELPDDIKSVLTKWRGYVSATKNEA
ncbi:MAG: RluA family pseudouridine synthase [Bacteroidota bacterium]